MDKIAAIWMLIAGCYGDVTFHMMQRLESLNGLVAPSGYLKRATMTANDVTRCASNCITMADCQSFFFDSASYVCQYHSAFLDSTYELTSSPTSLYYRTNAEYHSIMAKCESKEIIKECVKGCPVGWSSYGLSCYYKDNVTRSYDDAKINCGQLGAELVRIENADENSYIDQLIAGDPVLDTSGTWLDLTDIVTQGTWVWNATNQAPSFTGWDGGQPQMNDERCVVKFPLYGYTWHDVGCSNSFYTICKL